MMPFNVKVRGNSLYIDITKDGARTRIATGLKMSDENVKFIEKNFALFIKDKAAALKKHAKFTDELWERKNLTAHEKGELNRAKRLEKARAKNEERFLIDSVFSSLEKERYLQGLKIASEKSFASAKFLILEFLQGEGVFDIRAITREICVKFAEFLREKGHKKNSRDLRLKYFNQLLKYACEVELLDKNPFFKAKERVSVAESEQMKPFNLDEIQALVRAAKGDLKDFLGVAFFTGARTGELFGLMWDDVDFVKNEIHIRRTLSCGIFNDPKTNKERTIDMLSVVRNVLINRKCNAVFEKGADGFIFAKSLLSKIHADFKALVNSLNLAERRLYDTRHSFASVMLAKGEEPLWVGVKMLGHSNLNTTFKYYAKYLPRPVTERAAFLDGVDLESENSLFDEVEEA